MSHIDPDELFTFQEEFYDYSQWLEFWESLTPAEQYEESRRLLGSTKYSWEEYDEEEDDSW